jgi:MFS family permease
MSSALVIESRPERRRVIIAASAGTIFEWFDFFLYGTLAAFFSRQFFPAEHEGAAFLASLATLGAGFVVRPLGALLFGRLGDLYGRKFTFLATVLLMGVATVLMGCVPTYAEIGLWAPILLVLLRLLQGLAVGGEVGGAATYVAEHAPPHRRAFDTSFIQGTGTMGLVLALLVIFLTQRALGEAAFADWGWRVPFLSSVLLLALSVYIRVKLTESPLFAALKAEGKLARTPIREALLSTEHRRSMWIALVTLTAAQGVVWNAGQFYPLLFLQSTLGLTGPETSLTVALALFLSSPLYVWAGFVADRVGRRATILTGFALSVLLLLPLFYALRYFALEAPSAVGMVLTLMLLTLPVALVCAPASAFLVELFPTRIRYTAMGLPYHLGNGWFGGFMPLITAALSQHYANPFVGLIYPIGMAALCGIAGYFLMPETRDRAF